MTNKSRTTQFDIPNLAFAGVSDDTTVGFNKLAARENAPNPRYLAVITDQGELSLYDKDGSKIYGPVGAFAGHGSPDELSVNINKLVLIRSGTSLALINADGTLRWNLTGASAIANLEAAKVGSLYVCTLITVNGNAAASGVQWRSLVDGSVVQNLYGTAQNPNKTYPPIGGIAVGTTGERAAIVYIRMTGGVQYPQLEHHQIVAGRLWSVNLGGYTSAIQPASGYVIKIAVDKDCGYTIATCKWYSEGTADPTNVCAVHDNTGALLGTPWSALAAQVYAGVCMTPDGRLAGGYSNVTMYRVIVVPYTSTTTALAGRGHGIDASDDDLFYVIACEDGKIYVWRVDGAPLGNMAYGGVASPIAVVRNWA